MVLYDQYANREDRNYPKSYPVGIEVQDNVLSLELNNQSIL